MPRHLDFAFPMCQGVSTCPGTLISHLRYARVFFNTPWRVKSRILDVPGCLNTPWHFDFCNFDTPGPLAHRISHLQHARVFYMPWHIEFRIFDTPGCFDTPWHVDFRIFHVGFRLFDGQGTPSSPSSPLPLDFSIFDAPGCFNTP